MIANDTSAKAQPWSRIARRIRVPLGFVFAVVYLWLAKPTVVTIVAGSVVVGAGLLIRAIASGQLKKNEELATSGPYSYTRNPLYLGSTLIGIGFAVAARDLWVWIVLVSLYVLIYIPVIRSEEAFLRLTFPDFELYARRVPRLLPRWSGENLSAGFSRALYLKHREYNAFVGAVLMMAAVTVKMLTVKNA
jgi:protein-S-isoprenylcysteine O-methyltransferase Ste14